MPARRLALSSTCTQLLRGLSSVAWPALSASVATASSEASLAAFLARRKEGLRKLQLKGAHCGPAVLEALAGSAATHIEWRGGALSLEQLRAPRLRSLLVAPVLPPARVQLGGDCAHLPELR